MSQAPATYSRAPITTVEDLLADRQRVYAHFIGTAKYAIIVMAVILILMAITLV